MTVVARRLPSALIIPPTSHAMLASASLDPNADRKRTLAPSGTRRWCPNAGVPVVHETIGDARPDRTSSSRLAQWLDGIRPHEVRKRQAASASRGTPDAPSRRLRRISIRSIRSASHALTAASQPPCQAAWPVGPMQGRWAPCKARSTHDAHARGMGVMPQGTQAKRPPAAMSACAKWPPSSPPGHTTAALLPATRPHDWQRCAGSND